MKIALLDLNHTTCGVHTNTCPLGIGLIKRYTETHADTTETRILPEDIRMFKEMSKLQAALYGTETKVIKDIRMPKLQATAWIPDVVGIALYCWNTELNLFAVRLIKKLNPKAIIIAGGANVSGHPDIDFSIEFDGEKAFSSIIQQLARGVKKEDIKSEMQPRIKSLDVFGSVYADGLFDEFLDAGYHPFVQTHRGCPFGCSFCHSGHTYYNKMIFQSPDVFRKDMEYLARRFKGRDDVVLYIANTNMSLFKEDFEIAKIIREMQDTYNFPKFINVNSGKDPDKLLEMLKIIKFRPQIALQTLTPEVLHNVHRVNIPFEKYTAFQEEVVRQTGEPSATELILCLEGETMASFFETLRKVINSGVQQIVIFTLMNLKGTPISEPGYAARNKHVIRHRIVPRQFSEINGEKIFDTEEVIVATKDMPFEDYLDLRGLCYTIATVFSSSELIPLKRFLLESNIDIAQWVFNIHDKLWQYPRLVFHYTQFMKETMSELFKTREELIRYYENPVHYNELLEGKKGDNLLRKYKANTLSEDYYSVLSIAIAEARQLLDTPLADAILDDMLIYLNSRDMHHLIFNRIRPDDRVVRLRFDIPSWLSGDKSKRLGDMFGTFNYNVSYPTDIIETLDSYLGANKDAKLSMGILYRDGHTDMFWAKWNKEKSHIVHTTKEFTKLISTLPNNSTVIFDEYHEL